MEKTLKATPAEVNIQGAIKTPTAITLEGAELFKKKGPREHVAIEVNTWGTSTRTR